MAIMSIVGVFWGLCLTMLVAQVPDIQSPTHPISIDLNSGVQVMYHHYLSAAKRSSSRRALQAFVPSIFLAN